MPLETCIIVPILLQTPCRSWPCQNNGKCLPVYEKNDYKCICEGFRGKNCEKGKKYSRNTVPHFSQLSVAAATRSQWPHVSCMEYGCYKRRKEKVDISLSLAPSQLECPSQTNHHSNTIKTNLYKNLDFSNFAVSYRNDIQWDFRSLRFLNRFLI